MIESEKFMNIPINEMKTVRIITIYEQLEDNRYDIGHLLYERLLMDYTQVRIAKSLQTDLTNKQHLTDELDRWILKAISNDLKPLIIEDIVKTQTSTYELEDLEKQKEIWRGRKTLDLIVTPRFEGVNRNNMHVINNTDYPRSEKKITMHGGIFLKENHERINTINMKYKYENAAIVEEYENKVKFI